MARLVLDLEAFRHNVRTLSTLVAPARTMLAVKADAYGHGMIQFANAALESGADSLAVLEVPAALDLRRAGITAPLFAWLHGADTDFGAAIEAEVDLGVSSIAELEAIATAHQSSTRAAGIHLTVDTGLHRNGASPEEWPALVAAALGAEEAGHVRIAGLWSHLADASPADDAAALAEFRAAVAVAVGLGIPSEGPDSPLLHLAASSAGIRMPEARLDLVRFGIAAYGVSPFDDVDARGLGLRPAMTLVAEVIALDDGLAVLDLGSADGIPPSVLGPSGSGAEVLLAGARAAVVAVEIDSITLSLPTDATVALGGEAIVFGTGDSGEPTAEDWATWAGTIGDEIVVRASRRIPREYLG
jgi:alanine racemase